VYICEFSLYLLDPKNPDYAMAELDVYGWIPPGLGERDHRLSIRKNVKTGKYEVYRRYNQAYIRSAHGLTVFHHDELDEEAVALESGDLREVVDFSNREWRKYHGDPGKDELDKVCLHSRPDIGVSCDLDKYLEGLVCPRCGKEYRAIGDLPDAVRLVGHLTGKHGMKGDELRWTLEYAQRTRARANSVLKEARH